MATIAFKLDRTQEAELSERVARRRKTGDFSKLTEKEKAVLFLRAVQSRASLALPAFYLYMGARSGDPPECIVQGYPGAVLTHTIGFSSISTVALAASKAFQDGNSGLTGARFGASSDAVLEEIADHWTKGSGRPREHALAALFLLRSLFKKFSVKGQKLIDDKANTPLGFRIGLLKEYRNEEAAHLGSMRGYEFSILDCAHVVAALALVGAIIADFDSKELPSYFDEIDRASASAAKQLFPSMPDLRLFQNIEASTHSRWCWHEPPDVALTMLDQDLLYAIGWF
jgi:hypothetical protein